MSKHDYKGQQPKAQVLLVDDDPELLRFLYQEFTSDKVTCTCSNSGGDALTLLRKQRFDLVVLDWTLPDFNGLEICRRLRRSSNTTPVLMLTARDDVDERVQALDAGVDDYLIKPFSLKELHARVRARLRRGGYEQSARSRHSDIELGDLQLDQIERRVQRGERCITLSQREFELLLFLVKNADAVQSRQIILHAVWGKPFIGDPNTLDVYMGYLRKKVEAKGETQLLHTVRGVGFMSRVGDPKS